MNKTDIEDLQPVDPIEPAKTAASPAPQPDEDDEDMRLAIECWEMLAPRVVKQEPLRPVPDSDPSSGTLEEFLEMVGLMRDGELRFPVSEGPKRRGRSRR